MPNTGLKTNRREHPRFSPKGCIFVADQKIGRIVNISNGGMAFYYADREAWPQTVAQTGTLQCQNEHAILNLPMETISDIELPNNYAEGAITVRRRSVRFGQLTTPQREQINNLIKMAGST